MSSPSLLVRNAANRLVSADRQDFEKTLNVILNEFLGWPFQASAGIEVDSAGQKTDRFGSIVFVAQNSSEASEDVTVSADNVACIIDVNEDIDVNTLRIAYEKVARAKRLKKTQTPQELGHPTTTVTLRVIIARNTTAPLDVLAEEIQALNAKYPDREWPEMVAVLSKGSISYAIQFPGEHVLGDMLPPAEGTSVKAPWYVILSLKPAGEYTFNRFFAYKAARQKRKRQTSSLRIPLAIAESQRNAACEDGNNRR